MCEQDVDKGEGPRVALAEVRALSEADRLAEGRINLKVLSMGKLEHRFSMSRLIQKL